ncbi:MAG: apolipoprotein N-acyltransferase [bacterium]|nr:apolipoprotein N-acyltransferase [bacterium]
MSWLSRISLAASSAIGIALAHPDVDQGWLAWWTLAPLLVAVDGLPRWRAALLGLAFGYANAALIHHWIFDLPGFGSQHAAALGLVLAAYPALYCVLAASRSRSRLPAWLWLPALWAALEFMRAHLGFLAFPWANLAHTQANAPIWIQVASVTGEAGVSFLIVVANTALADASLGRLDRRGFGVVALLLVFALGFGWASTRGAEEGSELRVAVVQPNIPLDEPQTSAALKARFEKLQRLTLLAAGDGVDLVAWPETAVRGLAKTPALEAGVLELASQLEASLIVGSSDAEKLRPATATSKAQRVFYNSAYHVKPHRRLDTPYHKVRLLPFAEYRPLEDWIRWPTWLVPHLFNIRAGHELSELTLSDGTRFGILICWENLFSDLSRSWVRDGARLLVHISNDNWFGPTAEPRQHYAASVLRAVETGVPILIASNTGPSQIIDSRGRRVSVLPALFQEGSLAATVRIRSSTTPYVAIGDLFSWLCVALSVSGAMFTAPRSE